MNEELKITITAETDKLQKSLKDTKKALKETNDSTKKSSDEMKKFGDALKKSGDVAKKAFVGVGKAVTAGFAAVGGAVVGVVKGTEEIRINQAKLKTAFEVSGSTAATAKKVYSDLYKVLGEDDTAVEAANHLAKITNNEKDLQEWTKICQGVYATFGDSLPIEGLTEASNETAKVGKVTGSLADALNWANVNEDEFNKQLEKCNNESEREKLIRETLSGLYDEAAEKYGKNAEGIMKQREAQLKMKESLSKLGEALQPVVTAFSEFGVKILEEIAPKIEKFMSEHNEEIQKGLQEAAEHIKTLSTHLGNALSFISDNWEIIAALGATLLAIGAALVIVNTAVAINNALAVANPWTWIILAIIAAVVALVAAIVILIKHWDEVKAAFTNVWNNMKAGLEELGKKWDDFKEKVKNKITEIKENVVSGWENMKTNVKNKMNEIKAGVVEKWEAVKEGVRGKIDSIKETASAKFEAIKNFVPEKMAAMKESALEKFEAIKTGIGNKLEAAKNTVREKIEAIKSFFHFSWELPKFKMPHFSKSGKFSLNPPQVPNFKVSWYAKGGVFDKPTMFNYGGNIGGLGEAGAEAVVPLEKNTEWLDRIAERLNKGSNKPVILNVDGKTFAKTCINTINDLTSQTGSLPLRLY